MAVRSDAVAYDRLHHFIAAGLWDSAPLQATLWRRGDELVGGGGAWLIIDHTALPKKDKASVGVAPQYATALGKSADIAAIRSEMTRPAKRPLVHQIKSSSQGAQPSSQCLRVRDMRFGTFLLTITIAGMKLLSSRLSAAAQQSRISLTGMNE